MAVDEFNKQVAKFTASVFKGKPSVNKYYDKAQKADVDVLCCYDSPQEGCNSYSTIGLNKVKSGYRYHEKELRIELIISGYERFTFLPNIIASSAFNLINDRIKIAPGLVHKNVVSEYYENCKNPHLLFALPFLWGEGLRTQEIDGELVSWLYGIPISAGELSFLDAKGFCALDAEFGKKQINVFDLHRESAV